MPDKAMLPTSDDDDGKKKDSVFYTSAPGPDIQCLKSKQSLKKLFLIGPKSKSTKFQVEMNFGLFRPSKLGFILDF